MMDIIQSNLMQILATIMTAVASWLGVTIKKAYTKYIDTKTKKEIVNSTVSYVEQVCKTLDITGAEKFEKAKQKALEWLKEKGIKISDTELEIMIESAVNSFNQTIQKKG